MILLKKTSNIYTVVKRVVHRQNGDNDDRLLRIVLGYDVHGEETQEHTD